MPGILENPLKGTNLFLVTSSNGKWLQVLLNYSTCVDQTSDSCVMSAPLCSPTALLRDSPNYCNKCFPSEGGLEICESQFIKATLKEKSTRCLVYDQNHRVHPLFKEPEPEECFINDTR